MSAQVIPYYHQSEIQMSPVMGQMSTHGGETRRATGFDVQKKRYSGIDNTVSQIIKLIREARTNLDLRALALSITSNLPASSRTGGNPDMRNFDVVAETLYKWVIQNIRYTRDPNDTEWLQAPMITVQLQAGDCDDMTILSCALMEAVGIPTRFRIMGRGDYQHIVAEFEGKNGWVMFDPTLGSTIGAGPDMQTMTHDKVIGLSGLSDGLAALDPITAVADLLNTGISALANRRAATTNAQMAALQVAENDKQRAHELAVLQAQKQIEATKAVPVGNRMVFFGEPLDIAGYKIPMLPVLLGGVAIAIILARR